MTQTEGEALNRHLAAILRDVQDLREDSWDDNARRYRRTYQQCYEMVGLKDNPITLILDCLFMSKHDDTWDFCDQVLGSPKA